MILITGECFDDKHLELVRTMHNRSKLVNPTIITQNMNGAFAKWISTYNFDRYQWFFYGLSYLEIVLIDENNINDYITKVNKYAMTKHVIRKSIQKEICTKTKVLRERPVKFHNILLVILNYNYFHILC